MKPERIIYELRPDEEDINSQELVAIYREYGQGFLSSSIILARRIAKFAKKDDWIKWLSWDGKKEHGFSNKKSIVEEVWVPILQRQFEYSSEFMYGRTFKIFKNLDRSGPYDLNMEEIEKEITIVQNSIPNFFD